MKKTVFLLGLVALLVVGGCTGAPNTDWELEISGEVENPLIISYKELAGMELVDMADVWMDKSTGEDRMTSWSGVMLDTLLQKAGAAEDYCSMTAIAADGYMVEITREELQGAFITLKDGGEWIAKVDAEHGPIRIVCPQTPSSKWVYALTELQVNR